MYPVSNTKRPRSRKGFTLTELMIVLTISGFVSMGLFAFTRDTSMGLFISSEKLKINRDIRQLTAEMTEFARDANQFYIYKSFNVSDRNASNDRQLDGNTGDFLLLVYHEPYPNFDDPEHFTRYIGYFRRPDANGRGPVYRFEKQFAPADYIEANKGPEYLISGVSMANNFEEVIELSRGLADGNLFYNFNNNSVMIKAEIIHGNDAKRVTDTYNFTISPRGMQM
jgi:prepilin-type N-terminal cleavage/methylation domain-containing protein